MIQNLNNDIKMYIIVMILTFSLLAALEKHMKRASFQEVAQLCSSNS